MIRLHKGQMPPILVANGNSWTSTLLEHINRGEEIPDQLGKSYNHPQIKTQLEIETAGKCMYCEGRIKDLGYNHIEHYRPKDRRRYPQLTFEWANLGIACNVCNTNKGEEFDEAVPYINPYLEEPSSHFFASGAFVFPKPGDARARLTELKVQLNRKGLVESRGDALIRLNRLISEYHVEATPSLKDVLREQIWIECNRDKEFSFVLCAFAEFAGVPKT